MAFMHDDYTIGWIAALDVELAPAIAMLDQPLHEDLPKDLQDINTYTLGKIGDHNIVIAGLPAGSIGTSSAIQSASHLTRTFPNIRFILMVGIGGGVPHPDASPTKDVRLGDIVVSNPDGNHGGVIQYDFGTSIQAQGSELGFVRKGTLNKPPIVVRTAITKLRAHARLSNYRFGKYYEEIFEKYPLMAEDYLRPKIDRLFQPDYVHAGGDCSKCLASMVVNRRARKIAGPVVHYGNIGCANQVLRDALTRDRLFRQEGLICFEMEAAGLMDINCLVIRGICDYCDSHKNKDWQPYSSAVAAAYAKELLLIIPSGEIRKITPISKITAAVELQINELREQHLMIRDIDTKLKQTQIECMAEKDQRCLQELGAADPDLDKRRIEAVKGGLLKLSYEWILRNSKFTQWLKQGGLLWINAGPGKGKTMLTCGIINELRASCSTRPVIFYFCEAANNDNNTAAAILRGLLYMIGKHLGGFAQNIRSKIDRLLCSSEANAWYLLVDIFEEAIKDKDVYALIDGVDECKVGRNDFLKLMTGLSTVDNLRCIISSRNVRGIDLYFDGASRLDLELCSTSISQAVTTYIDHKVLEMTEQNSYSSKQQSFIRDYLSKNSESTFLWVALVSDNLRDVQPWEVEEAVQSFPPGLEKLYSRMLDDIAPSRYGYDVSRRVLAILTLVYRPVSLGELQMILDLPPGFGDLSWLERAVFNCGSFVVLQDRLIRLVHQSAKDFLEKNLQEIFDDQAQLHFQICNKSMQAMKTVLRQDICNFRDSAYEVRCTPEGFVDNGIPKHHPILAIKYSCHHWLEHLLESRQDPIIACNTIGKFLHDYYLYWLEAMSLYGTLAKGIHLMHEIQQVLNDAESHLKIIVEDAIRFVLHFREIIERFPLQLYNSCLIFCPRNSKTLSAFFMNLQINVATKKLALEDWPATILEFETDNDSSPNSTVTAMAWESNTGQTACCDSDGSVHLYDALSGQCTHHFNLAHWAPIEDRPGPDYSESHREQQILDTSEVDRLFPVNLKDPNKSINSSDGFRPQGTSLEAYTKNGTVADATADPTKDGDVNDHDKQGYQYYNEISKGPAASRRRITAVAIQQNSKEIVFVEDSYRLYVWAYEANKLQRVTISSDAHHLTVSPDGISAAYAYEDRKVRLIYIDSSKKGLSLDGHTDMIDQIQFSTDSGALAAISIKQRIVVWHLKDQSTNDNSKDRSILSSAELPSVLGRIQLSPLDPSPAHIALSPKGKKIAVSVDTRDGFDGIRVYDVASTNLLYEIRNHSCPLFSYDSKSLLVSSSEGFAVYDALCGIVKYLWPPQEVPEARYERAVMSSSADRMVLARQHLADRSSHLLLVETSRLLKSSLPQQSRSRVVCRLVIDRREGRCVVAKYADGRVELYPQENEANTSSSIGERYLVSSLTGCAYTMTEESGIVYCHSLVHGLWNILEIHDCSLPIAFANFCCVGANGSYIVYLDSKGKTRVRSMTPSAQTTIELQGPHLMYDHPRYWTQVGSKIAAVIKPGTSVVIWALQTGQEINIVDCLEGYHVICVEMFPDEHRIALGVSDGRVLIVSISDCRTISELRLKHMPYSIAISINGEFCGFSTDKTIEIWNSSSYTSLYVLETGLGIGLVHISNDGKTLWTNRGMMMAKHGELQFGTETGIFCHEQWIMKNGTKLLRLPRAYQHFNSSGIFYADGLLCIVDSDNGVSILDFHS